MRMISSMFNSKNFYDMEDLIKLLENPFDNVKTKDEFQKKCEEIATKLFNDYCINCNGKEFYFAEIEFYYWQKEKWKEKWNKVTYARDGYNGGDLFFHLSGVDICFESSFADAKFGGILIRSVYVIDGDTKNFISGPLNCKDAILNASICGSMPKLSKTQNKKNIIPTATYRSLGKKDMEEKIDGALKLCFFDINYINKMNPAKEWFNKETGVIQIRQGTYNIDKFNANEI